MFEAAPHSSAFYVTARESADHVRRVFGEVAVIDARSGSRFSEPALLEQTIVTAVRDGATRVVIDGLEAFANQWGSDRAVGLFKRVCPRLFDLGAILF